MDFDWTVFGVGIIQALTPVVVPLFIALGRAAWANTPRILVPIVAVALGTGLDLLNSYVTGQEFSVIVGALLGAAAVFVREFVDTYVEHGLGS